MNKDPCLVPKEERTHPNWVEMYCAEDCESCPNYRFRNKHFPDPLEGWG